MEKPSFPVMFLWIVAILFVGFGLGFVVAPKYFAELITGAAPAVPSAVTDMRATYGGVAIGMGLFFAVAARRSQWLRAGLLASLLVVAGIGGARLIGIIADGKPNAFMLVFLTTELFSVALNLVALRRLGDQTR